MMNLRFKARPHRRIAVRAGLLALLWLLPTSAGAAQSLAEIEQAVKAHVEREFSTLGTISAIEITSLDPRLKLADCDKPLEAFTANGQRRLGNTTIGVRCSGVRPWTLYVPVKIASQVTVLTAAQPLARGALLKPSDLVPIARDAAALPHGYFIEPRELTGMQLKRALRAGEVILPNAVSRPPLVERGQEVLLTAEAGGIKVSMKGEALQDGAAGERIQVRNLSSRKVVEGEVLGRNHVRVPL
jgi:flagella basal body P-ring formation protein FlgA